MHDPGSQRGAAACGRARGIMWHPTTEPINPACSAGCDGPPRGALGVPHGRADDDIGAGPQTGQRLAPDPICDDCITEKLGLSVRQHANHKTRELAFLAGRHAGGRLRGFRTNGSYGIKGATLNGEPWAPSRRQVTTTYCVIVIDRIFPGSSVVPSASIVSSSDVSKLML